MMWSFINLLKIRVFVLDKNECLMIWIPWYEFLCLKPTVNTDTYIAMLTTILSSFHASIKNTPIEICCWNLRRVQHTYLHKSFINGVPVIYFLILSSFLKLRWCNLEFWMQFSEQMKDHEHTWISAEEIKENRYFGKHLQSMINNYPYASLPF